MEENNILYKNLIEVMALLKPCIILKQINKQILDLYISNEPVRQVDLSYLNGDEFWESIYKEVLKITNPDIDVFNVSDSGNMYKSAIIKLNEYVKIVITNRNHKYDLWIDDLQDKPNILAKQKVKKIS